MKNLRKKTALFSIVFICRLFSAYSQRLTLEECQKKATENYPAITRFNVIEQSKKFNLANTNMAYLPQLSLGAKATWQSDVTKVPLEMPGVEIPTIDKDQYQAVAELNQVIWDGGMTEARKKSIRAGAELEKQQLESEAYTLR